LDVSNSPWIDWFHGGLNFQVVHHIWPRIARPNLRAAQTYLIEFCKKHNIEYKIVSLSECIWMIVKNMKEIADQVDDFVEVDKKHN